jgi:hypothetical protein
MNYCGGARPSFWQGTGVSDLLVQYAEEQISDDEFRCERGLPNGWLLNTKEELICRGIFKERFGEQSDLQWMGRTNGAPQQ